MRKISRRSFAKSAVVVATAAAIMPASFAQTEPSAPKLTAAVPRPPAAPAPLSAASQAEVDARINWIYAKYGAHLNDEQRADIKRLITGGQAGLDAMRAYDLGNSAQPAELFRIYRAAPRKVSR